MSPALCKVNESAVISFLLPSDPSFYSTSVAGKPLYFADVNTVTLNNILISGNDAMMIFCLF